MRGRSLASVLLWALCLLSGLSGAPHPAVASGQDSCHGPYERGAHDEAIAACTELLRAEGLPSAEKAAALATRGGAHLAKRQPEPAIRDLTESLHLRPDQPEAFYRRGLAHARTGQHGLAERDLTRAILLKPDWAEAYYARGQVREDLGQLEPAIKDYDRAVEILPGFVSATNRRANAYVKAGLPMPGSKPRSLAVHREIVNTNLDRMVVTPQLPRSQSRFPLK